MGLGITVQDKLWEFEPKEDVTAWELAQCMSIILEGFVTPRDENDNEFQKRLMVVKRHFRVHAGSDNGNRN